MMLIRSQDRKTLVPLAKVHILDGNGFFEICNDLFPGGGADMGHYKTESRCIEILDEIQKIFGNYMRVDVNSVPTQLFDYPKVFQMPEK